MLTLFILTHCNSYKQGRHAGCLLREGKTTAAPALKKSLSEGGGGGGGTLTHFYPDFKKKIPENYHNGVGILSIMDMWLTAELTSKKTKQKDKKS